MGHSRRRTLLCGLVVLYGFATLAITGCDKGPDAPTTTSTEGGVKVHFSVPWANRLGRPLSMAEIRFHGLAGGEGFQQVSGIRAPNEPITLSDDLGNIAWVYRMRDVQENATGVIEISAVVSEMNRDAEDMATDASNYLSATVLPDPGQASVDRLQPIVCQSDDAKVVMSLLHDLYLGKDIALGEDDDVSEAVAAADDGVGVELSTHKTNDIALVVALARACGYPARIVLGVSREPARQTGANIRQWVEVYLSGKWELLLPAEIDPSARLVRMHVISNGIPLTNASPFFSVAETVGVSIDPGAVRISIQ